MLGFNCGFPTLFFLWRFNMSVQMIELEEVAMVEVNDEILESSGSVAKAGGSVTGIYYCIPC
jgi:hypothetical protein